MYIAVAVYKSLRKYPWMEKEGEEGIS